jgi:hypothetical protein
MCYSCIPPGSESNSQSQTLENMLLYQKQNPQRSKEIFLNRKVSMSNQNVHKHFTSSYITEEMNELEELILEEMNLIKHTNKGKRFKINMLDIFR